MGYLQGRPGLASVTCERVFAPLQEHAAEVKRLVNIAYGDLPPDHRAGMRLETFCNTLGYLPLQRHLLAIPTHTLEDAVRTGNECMQMKPANKKGNTNVCQVGDKDKEEVENPTKKALTVLMKTMQQLVEKVEQLQSHPTRTAKKGEPCEKWVCWECGKGGHLKRNCPHMKTFQPAEQAASRNGQGPQQ